MGGIAVPRLFGDQVLRVEGEQVIVAAGLTVEITAEAGQVAEGLLQLGRRIGRADARWFGIVQLVQPADELEIAEAAGRLLDVRLEVIKGVGVLGVAVAGELRRGCGPGHRGCRG